MAQTKRGAKRCLKDGTAYPTGLSRRSKLLSVLQMKNGLLAAQFSDPPHVTI